MPRTKSFVTVGVIAAAAVVLLSNFTAAQEPGSRTEEQAQEQARKAGALGAYTPPWIERKLLSIENAGGFGVARGVVAAFGDIKRGSSVAIGPSYGKTFASGAVFRAKGVYSIRNYKLLQASFASQPLANGRVKFGGRARWQDAPSGAVFPIGPDSPDLHAAYAETRTEVSGYATAEPVRFLRFEAGAGLERYDTDLPTLDDELRDAPSFANLPGAGADPDYLHSYASAAIDSRDGPGYSRRGTLLRGTLHDYRDQNDGPYSFQRLDGTAEQYVPILQGNWVLFLRLHASTTATAADNTVPFFLLPDLGGHDLRGFANYRFRDRHFLVVTAEYRWYAQEYLDGAIFYDAGKAVANRSQLDFTGLQSSIGAGIRLHSAQATALRLEVAHSREGFRYIISFSAVGGGE